MTEVNIPAIAVRNKNSFVLEERPLCFLEVLEREANKFLEESRTKFDFGR